MSRSNLPPVRHLPQWSRLSRIGRPRSPRRLASNQRPVYPPAERGGRPAAAEASRDGREERRVASMQRNLEFVQQQHGDTLRRLHAEIEHLRRENKELHYKLIMEPHGRGTGSGPNSTGPLAQESVVCVGVSQKEALQETGVSQDAALRSLEQGRDGVESALQDSEPNLKGALITSLQPLRVSSSLSHPPRPPTLEESQIIVHQLYSALSLQSQEMVRVKALLRDVVRSRRITAENYLLTKAYLVGDTCKPSETKQLPEVGLQTCPERSSRRSRPGLVLPALKQSLSSKVAETQRRAHTMQRERYKRALH